MQPTVEANPATIRITASVSRSPSGQLGNRFSTARVKPSISSIRNTATTSGVMMECRYFTAKPPTTTATNTPALRSDADWTAGDRTRPAEGSLRSMSSASIALILVRSGPGAPSSPL